MLEYTMSDIKTLMGDAISEETANALQAILDESIASKDSEITELQEKLADAEIAISDLKESHETDVEFLKQKADEYADQVTADLKEAHAEREAYLIERAEAYGEHLIERGEAYGEHLIEQAEAYGEHLIEQADAYGDYLQERAEAYGEHLIERAESYGEHLIEQADAYGESIEAKCLEEATAEIESFKEEHLEAFTRVDEHARMAAVFTSLKSLVESSGFSLDESTALEEAVAKQRVLNRKLRDSQESLKKYKVAELIEGFSDEVTFKDKERITAAALMTRCSNDEDLSNVVKTLVESSLNKNTNPATSRVSLNEQERRSVKNPRIV